MYWLVLFNSIIVLNFEDFSVGGVFDNYSIVILKICKVIFIK